MTPSTPVRVPPAIEIPELGPSLGRLALPTGWETTVRGRRVSLDEIRLELATAIFDLAADARSWSSAGDREAAVDTLGRSAWLGAWEIAVRSAGERLTAEIDARIRAAAEESKLPRRHRQKLLLTEPERRAVLARLGGGGVALVVGLEALDRAGHRVRAAGVLDREAGERWRDSLTTAARKLEASWLELELAADREWEHWTPLIESARNWRRPRWVLWAISAAVLGMAVYVGLVVGGYLQGPPFLDAFAAWWWDWWDRLVEPA